MLYSVGFLNGQLQQPRHRQTRPYKARGLIRCKSPPRNKIKSLHSRRTVCHPRVLAALADRPTSLPFSFHLLSFTYEIFNRISLTTFRMKEPVGFSEMFPYYQVATAIAVVLTLVPIPAHLKAGNVAAVSLGLWCFGGNLIALVNTLVWRGNTRNPYPIWGDITAFYFANMGTAISSCLLCIVYRLWKVASTQTALVSKQEVHLTWLP